MHTADRKSLDELIQALKQQKFAKNVSYNLTFFHEGRYIIWNDDDKCFYVCNFNEERQISFEHVSFFFVAFSFQFGVIVC